jgi:hypothetical protein
LRLWYSRVELGLKVPILDVEPVLTRPLHGDAGVLSRTPAVEFCPQVFGRALLTVGECTEPDAPP